MRAIEFIASYRISPEKILIDRLAGELIVNKTSDGVMIWSELYNLVAKIEKLIDASSGLLKYIAETINKDIKFAAPVISSIKFSSPGQLVINIDIAIVGLIIFLITKLQLWRLEKERYKEETRALKLNNDMREIEIARKAIKHEKASEYITKQLLDEIIPSIKKALNTDSLPSTLFEPGSLENGMLNERLLPAAAELAAGDDPDIVVKVNE